jgi:cytochrome P450
MTESRPIDLFDAEVQENWYPAYKELREEAPVFQIPDTSIFVLTRYEDIIKVVSDTVTFSTEPEAHGGDLLIKYPEARRYYQEHGLGKEAGAGRWTPLGVDPPRHRKYRSLIDKFFMGRALTIARPMIMEIITSLIDRFVSKGEIEFMRDFAEPLPVTVITKLIGFPVEDIPQLKVWSSSWAFPFARGLTPEQEMTVARHGVDFQNYIKRFADARRKDPQNDIITHLTQARFDDSRLLTDHEIASIVDNLYIGGNETTTFALSSGMWLMLRDRNVYEQLIADPTKIKTFLEEVLRLESPTQGLYRTVVSDTTIRGTAIPKGSTIHIRFAAANRDDAVFPKPDTLDLSRGNAAKHLAFSQGEHHCPGAMLSRLEQQMAYEQLVARLPNLRFTPNKNDFRHLPGFVLRSLRQLHLSFDIEAQSAH